MTPWTEDAFLWNRLQKETKPIVLYGMGDGADKTLALCRAYGAPVAGVFASDGFVRGQTYQGWRVKTLSQLEEELGELVVLLCFATQRPEVLEQVERVAAAHTLLAPDLPVCGDTIITPSWLEEHRDEILSLESLLADDRSRQVLDQVFLYKLTGDPAYLRRCETPRDQVFREVLPLTGEHFYLDGGAYTGDTLEEFHRALDAAGGVCRRALALEPDRRNFRKLQETVARLGYGQVDCRNLALWRERRELPFSNSSGRQAAVSGSGSGSATADSIDNLLAGRRPTLIKLDVEGSEEEALLGGRETISRYRPMLAVALYHRGDDLLRLPMLVHGLCKDYKLYIRHHPYLPAWETNLYARIE